MRVRRSFAPHPHPENPPPVAKRFKGSITAVPIIGGYTAQFLANDCEKRLYGGSIFNINYRFKKNFVAEATTAVLKESVRFNYFGEYGKASAKGFDDVVINIYYNFFPQKKGQIITHIIAGFPTSRKLSIFERHGNMVGTKLYSLGGWLEGSYTFYQAIQSSIAGIIQARCIHYFSRSVFPLLPCESILHPGNVTDLFIALHYQYKRHHAETGYDATLLSNERISTALKIATSKPFVRNSIYAKYIYTMDQGAVGCGISGQFVNNPFRSKGFSAWTSGTVLY